MPQFHMDGPVTLTIDNHTFPVRDVVVNYSPTREATYAHVEDYGPAPVREPHGIKVRTVNGLKPAALQTAEGVTEEVRSLLRKLEPSQAVGVNAGAADALRRLCWLCALTDEERAFVTAGLADRLDSLTWDALADYLEEHGKTPHATRVRTLRPRPGDLLVLTFGQATATLPDTALQTIDALRADAADAGFAVVVNQVPDSDLHVLDTQEMHEAGWVTREEALGLARGAMADVRSYTSMLVGHPQDQAALRRYIDQVIAERCTPDHDFAPAAGPPVQPPS
jgi:hypothetical protein